jgi:hypothetical protein
MARPEGFEPPTLCLEGRRSFQLSYGRVSAIVSVYGACRILRNGQLWRLIPAVPNFVPTQP